jgi:presenilin-like A22 family membrane protease
MFRSILVFIFINSVLSEDCKIKEYTFEEELFTMVTLSFHQKCDMVYFNNQKQLHQFDNKNNSIIVIDALFFNNLGKYICIKDNNLIILSLSEKASNQTDALLFIYKIRFIIYIFLIFISIFIQLYFIKIYKTILSKNNMDNKNKRAIENIYSIIN